MASRNRQEEQILRQFLAGVFVWLLAGLSAGVAESLCRTALGTGDGETYCATLRTSSLAFLSLALAWAGGRWGRAELSRLIYPTMILGGYRLIAVDFNQNRKLPLFFSLLAYGAALMALPRLARSPASPVD